MVNNHPRSSKISLVAVVTWFVAVVIVVVVVVVVVVHVPFLLKLQLPPS